MNASPPSAPADHRRTGFVLGLLAYGLWGVLPIYFKRLGGVGAFDIVAHRILWSLPFLALLITLARGWPAMRRVLASRGTVAILALTALLVGTNWLLYVYAVTSGQIIAASFGYYLNPLANVLLGRFVLGERLERLQWIAVVVAALGIAVLAFGGTGQLWISLALCVSFSLYGLIRKIVPVDSVAGLAVETALLFPFALGWIVWRDASGAQIWGNGGGHMALLLLAGVISTTPLILFNAAAKRLPYSTLGMLQFIAPTLQFLLAVLAYGEHFSPRHAIAFGAIWIALMLYVTALVRSPRLPSAPD